MDTKSTPPTLPTPVSSSTKPLNTTTIAEAKAAQSDLQVFGDGDLWKLICKASSKSAGWMKSTKAMEIEPGAGCLVQVTTEFRDANGKVAAIAEAVTFVPDCGVACRRNKDDKVIERRLMSTTESVLPIGGWDWENVGLGDMTDDEVEEK